MPKRKLYDPKSPEPFPFSRSRIENFVNCPRCFHLEERKGIKAPSGPQFLLNSGIDTLYKNEFDICRKEKKPHPPTKCHFLRRNNPCRHGADCPYRHFGNPLTSKGNTVAMNLGHPADKNLTYRSHITALVHSDLPDGKKGNGKPPDDADPLEWTLGTAANLDVAGQHVEHQVRRELDICWNAESHT